MQKLEQSIPLKKDQILPDYSTTFACISAISRITPEAFTENPRYGQYGRFLRTVTMEHGEVIPFSDQRLNDFHWLADIARQNKPLVLLELATPNYLCSALTDGSSSVITRIRNKKYEYQFLLLNLVDRYPPMVAVTPNGFRNVDIKENSAVMSTWILAHARVMASQLPKPIVLNEIWNASVSM